MTHAESNFFLVEILRGSARGLAPSHWSVRQGRFDIPRRTLLLGALSSLAACGFSPVHAPGGGGSKLRGMIDIAEPDSRNDFDFAARIEDRFGHEPSAPYIFTYKITTREEGVGVTPAQETTRYNVFGTVAYQITPRGTKTPVHSGQVENFTGYSATALIVGTQSSTRDANQRLMVVLADQVIARLLATAPDWAQ